MNSGAIEFKESKWTTMGSDRAIDLIMWLNNNLAPGYCVYKLATGDTYFVGESASLFDSPVTNQKYPIYKISCESEFTLSKTTLSFSVL